MSRLVGRAATDITVEDGEYPEEPLLAAGPHNAMAVQLSEGRNDSTGEDWVKVVFQLLDGPHTGMKVTDWWRYGGSAAAEEISEKKFKTLMTLCGVQGALNTLDQLTMVPIVINNKPYKGQNGENRNSINYYKRAGNANNQRQVVQQSAPQMTQQQAPMQSAPPQQHGNVPLQQTVAQHQPTPPQGPPMQQNPPIHNGQPVVNDEPPF